MLMLPVTSESCEKSMAPGLLPVAATGAAAVMASEELAVALVESVAVTPIDVCPPAALTGRKKLPPASTTAVVPFTVTSVMLAFEADGVAEPLTSTGLPCGKLALLAGAATVTLTGSAIPSASESEEANAKLDVAAWLPDSQALPPA